MTGRLFISALAATIILSGCGGGGDRTGGSGDDEPRVLRLANGGHAPGLLELFADEVHRRSNATLQVEFANNWRKRQVGYEAGIVDDVRAGKADLGWVGARVWPALGVHSFDALLAPFLVDSYELQERAIAELGDDMLDGLNGAGVHPVGVLPGPMRRLAAREPVTGPDDLVGRRLMIQPAAIEEAALQALGADVVGAPGSGAKLGDLDGTVQQLGSIAGNGYHRDARFITADLVPWPRPLVIFAGPAAWDRLSETQRAALREAARAVAPATLAPLRDEDAVGAENVCAGGAKLVRAGAAGRAAMRSAVEPVYEELRSDPTTARAIAAIERLRTSVRADAVHTCGPAPTPPEEVGIPAGTYVTTVTREDAREVPPEEWAPRVDRYRFRLVFTPGHLALFYSEDGRPEQADLEAEYSIFRDRIEIRTLGGDTITARWSFDGTRLRFTDIDGPSQGDDVVMGSHPWVKVD